MEAREVPAALAGNGIALPLYGPGRDTAVEVLNPATGAALTRSFPGFRGEIVAAAGDVNGDGVADAVVGVQNSGGLIAVIDGASGGILGSAFVFPGTTGKINVGTADLNGDGFADILVTASAPGAPVRAFDVHNGRAAGFNAFPGLTGQTSITGADLNGDGRDEIIVGIGGPNLGGRVAAFTAFGGVIAGLPVFPGFNGSISLAAGDVNGDGRDDLVIGAGPGSAGGEVKVISLANGAIIDDIVPFSPRVTNGVNVYVADGDGDGVADIFVTLQGGGYPSLAGFSGRTGGFLLGSGFGGGGDGTYSGYDLTSGDVGSYPDNTYYGGYYSAPDTSYYPTTDYSTPDYSSSYDSSYDSSYGYSYDYSSGYSDPGNYSDPDA